MRSKILAVITAAGLFSLSADAMPRLADLRTGDIMEISFRSQGCFHSYRNTIAISDGVATVDDEMSIPLTEDMIYGIDIYLHALDLGPSTGCTTVDFVDVTIQSRDGQQQSWNYMDGSCWTSSITFDNAARPWLPEGTDWGSVYSASRLIRAARSFNAPVE